MFIIYSSHLYQVFILYIYIYIYIYHLMFYFYYLKYILVIFLLKV